MSKTTTGKAAATRLGLFITAERDQASYGGDSQYFHIRASIVTIGTNAYERRRIDEGASLSVPYEKIRNVSEDDYGGLYLQDFASSCQGLSSDQPRHLYAFEYEYRNVGSVNGWRAAKMAATLKVIEKRLDALTDKYGRPASYGAYLARLADAVRADAFVFTKGKATGWSYDHNQHQITDISTGIWKVDQIADEWVREAEIAEEKRRAEQQRALDEQREQARADAAKDEGDVQAYEPGIPWGCHCGWTGPAPENQRCPQCQAGLTFAAAGEGVES